MAKQKAPLVRVLGVQTRPDYIAVQVGDNGPIYKYEASPYICREIENLVKAGANGKALQLLRRCPLVESPAPVNASTAKDIRDAYIKGAKDERQRAHEISDVGFQTYCRQCRIGITYLHASGLCKLCEVESRVE